LITARHVANLNVPCDFNFCLQPGEIGGFSSMFGRRGKNLPEKNSTPGFSSKLSPISLQKVAAPRRVGTISYLMLLQKAVIPLKKGINAFITI